MKSIETLIAEQRQRVAEAAERRRQAWAVNGWEGQPINPMAFVMVGAWNYHEAFKAWRRELDELERLLSEEPRRVA